MFKPQTLVNVSLEKNIRHHTKANGHAFTNASLPALEHNNIWNCNSYSICSDHEGLDDGLHSLVTWSADHGLLVNKTNCVECLLYPKKHFFPTPALPHQRWSFTSRANSQVSWCTFHLDLDLVTHIDTVFIKGLFIRRFHSMNAHKSLLWRIVSGCAIPSILYCLPIIFPELLIKISPLLQNAYLCYHLPVVELTHKFVKF